MINTVKIWRVYNNESVKNESHVLWPHKADGMQCTGYDGDVDAWSTHNKQHRGGCAQIVKRGGDYPEVLYTGYLDAERLAPIVKKLHEDHANG